MSSKPEHNSRGDARKKDKPCREGGEKQEGRHAFGEKDCDDKQYGEDNFYSRVKSVEKGSPLAVLTECDVLFHNCCKLSDRSPKMQQPLFAPDPCPHEDLSVWDSTYTNMQ